MSDPLEETISLSDMTEIRLQRQRTRGPHNIDAGSMVDAGSMQARCRLDASRPGLRLTATTSVEEGDGVVQVGPSKVVNSK